MYILYLDESGNPDGWNSQKNFIIGGIAIHEGQVDALSKQIDVVQAKYFPQVSFQINLHAHEIQAGVGHFQSLGSTKQLELLKDVYSVIQAGRYPNFTIFATDMDISMAVNGYQTVYDTFQDICKRFSIMLDRFYNRGSPTKGLLVIDEAHEKQYREMLREFKTTGTKYGYIRNIADVPYFGRSIHTRMIQVADFITYAVFRYYEYGDRTFFDMIKDRFDRRAPGEPPEALKHLTKNPCTCDACAWRT